jgi:hypothetical protein
MPPSSPYGMQLLSVEQEVASSLQEVIGKPVTRVRIANAHRLSCDTAIGKVVALIDIENRILPQHRHEARCRSIVHALVANLQLLRKVNFGTVLALPHVPPCLNVRKRGVR